MSKLTDLWAEVLAQLQLQMTRATYDALLLGSQVVGQEGQVVTVQVASQAAAEHLQLRHQAAVDSAVSRAGELDLVVEFVVQPAAGGAPAPAGEIAAPQPADSPARLAAESWTAFDHTVAGWARHSHYVALFWRPYLGAAAFDVWDYIRAHCRDGSLLWTPPLEVRPKELARRASCSVQRVTGVWRGCPVFDRQLEEHGQPLAACCGRWAQTEITITKPTADYAEGRPTCRHWVAGALEILAAEGLAGYIKVGDSPRSRFYRVQVYQPLPLLAPRQVARLDSAAQIEHLRWVRGLLGKDFGQWEASQLYSALAPAAAEIAAGLDDRLRALALNNGVLSASARNQIFFADPLCAKLPNSTQGR